MKIKTFARSFFEARMGTPAEDFLLQRTRIISINNVSFPAEPPPFSEHYLKSGNLLTLFFDDVESGFPNAMTVDDALKILEFTEKKDTRPILVHCSAGISRSGAVASFLNDLLNFGNHEDREKFFKDNRDIQPNRHVLKMLERCDRTGNPVRYLARAWYQDLHAPKTCAVLREELLELAEIPDHLLCLEWDAMIGLAAAIQDKELAWKFAELGGRKRQWGKSGEKWSFSKLLHHTDWEDVRSGCRARCRSYRGGIAYEMEVVKHTYDCMKRLTPQDDHDSELVFRPMFEDDGADFLIQTSFFGPKANPHLSIACRAPQWEEILGSKIDSDYAGMFQPGELIGPALLDYAFEFCGLWPSQINDRKVRKSFAASRRYLYKKYPEK